MPPQKAPTRAQRVKVLAKAFEILEALHAGNRDGARLSKIAEAVRLPRATVFRILRTLEAMGYVTFDGGMECYRIAQRLTELGQPNANVVFARLARPAMMRLLAEFEQTVNLAIVEDGRIVLKDLIEGLRSVRMQVTPGVVVSATQTALGKAILAFLPPEHIPGMARVLKRGQWRNERKKHVDKLLAELEEVQRLGYAVDDEEFEKGLRCVGSAVFDKSGFPIGAISVSGSTSTITAALISKIGARVQRECDEISFALGYSPQTR